MPSLLTLFVIYLVSLSLNWLVQLGYFLMTTQVHPGAFTGHKTLFDYYTGYIGDVIIVPLINILVFIFIVNSSFHVSYLTILYAFGVGLALDILAHYFQARALLTNWSMPKPFVWNFAGHWHMISFPVQISYLLLYLLSLWAQWHLVLASTLLKTVSLGIIALSLSFLFLFAIDYELI